jgi:predicted transcriptional regulator
MDNTSLDKKFYSEHINNIHICHVELYNINIDSLIIAKEYLDKILENNKYEEIEEIRDLLKIAKMSLEKATQKIDYIMDNRDNYLDNRDNYLDNRDNY